MITIPKEVVVRLYSFWDKWWNDTEICSDTDSNYDAILRSDLGELSTLAEEIEPYEELLKEALGGR